jgi:REP element-mobilizing transposase RayT
VISGRRAYRRHLPHFQQDNRSYYITFVTLNRWVLPPVARDLVLQHILFDDQRKMHLHTAIVMPDHGHLLITPCWDEYGDTYSLAEIMKGIKGSSARTVNLAFGRKGSLWLNESFDHELRSSESIQQKSEYIAMNPVRAGLCATPDEYPWLWRECYDRPQPEESDEGCDLRQREHRSD